MTRLFMPLAIAVMLSLTAAAALTERRAKAIHRAERQHCLDLGGDPVRLYGPHGVHLIADACVFGADSVISLEHAR